MTSPQGIAWDKARPRAHSNRCRDTLPESVAKTGRLVVADEGRLRAGVVARMDAPVSNTQTHEGYISPSAEKIAAAA